MSENDPDRTGSGWGGSPPLPPGPVPAGYAPAQRVDAVPLPPRTPFSQAGPVPERPGTSPAGLTGPPSTKKQAWRWLFYAVIGFIVGQIVAVIFGSVAGGIAGKSAAQMKIITAANVPPEWYVVSTLLGLWIGFVGAPWLASRTQGTRHFLADLGVRFRAIDLVGILIGVGAQIVIAVMYAPFQHDIHNFNAPSQKLTGSAHGGGFLIIALATVLLAPFMEELFFRGLLFKALVRLFAPEAKVTTRARRASVVVAVIVDGLLFGLAHGEWVQLAGLALFGAVLAAVSYRTGRLGMNIVAHASFNLVAVLAILSQRGGVIH
ncbi:MAG TPA: CPBP family intramembrane glutamic endopeptidase [Acidimicrobiales bacterium]|nr:CPBP family intramembrane glutamic endopeptidase [Acidimicrobiales bacterium]